LREKLLKKEQFLRGSAPLYAAATTAEGDAVGCVKVKMELKGGRCVDFRKRRLAGFVATFR
jgi:hypothetical protein